MQMRLATLADVRRGARTGVREGGSATLASLAMMAPQPRRRDAASGRFDQWKLREFVQSLVTAYGYRDDFRGKNTPWRVPYIPQPFAGEMVEYFAARGRYWLRAKVPVEAKQPNFINIWTKTATEIVGRVERGRVITPNPDSYEDAPPAMAAKAPAMFKPDVPAGQPHAKVLKAAAAWRLLDALVRLAIHFDALSGQPTKLEIFEEAVKEQVESAGNKALAVAEGAYNLPGSIAGIGKDTLRWIAIGAVGLGALW